MNNFAKIVFAMPVNQTFDYIIPENILDKINIGKRVEVEFGKKKEIGFVINIVNSSTSASKNIISVLDDENILTNELLSLSKKISEYYACSLGEALSLIAPKKWKARISKTQQEIVEKHISTKNFFTPTIDQQNILNKILPKINNNEYSNFLLHGIAGSGKTEIYLHSIKETLNQNKQAIYLLPEIFLTPQIFGILRERFGNKVVLWHSKMTDRERFIVWKDILAKKFSIIVGPRSAIFAPFTNIGTIIIDEEQEDSYKQDQKPLYDARTIARWRAKYHNATLILGSATPRIETFYKSINKKNHYLNLPKKIFEKNENEHKNNIRIVNMKIELERKNFSVISDILKKAILLRLEQKEQIVLFLNRRGFSTHVFCRKCGYVMKCPNCDISLVYHTDNENLICHYCGYKTKMVSTCPECHSSYIKHFGAGVQRVERELQKLFPTAKIARLDQDTTDKNNIPQIYEDFKNQKYDILLGTQIVAKGLDFPNVTLVGVVSADTALNLADFRASERTFSLLTQVAGRAGRRNKKGEVIIQTYYPDHYAVQLAANIDYKKFYDEEIKWRKELMYPPFTKLVIVTLRGRDDKKVKTEIEKLAQHIKNYIDNDSVKMIGPFKSVIHKKYNNYRWQILFKEINDENTKHTYLKILLNQTFSNDIKINIDVDPVGVM